MAARILNCILIVISPTVIGGLTVCKKRVWGSEYTDLYCNDCCCGSEYLKYCCLCSGDSSYTDVEPDPLPQIIGIVVGCIILAAIIISVIVCCVCCMRSSRGSRGQVMRPSQPVSVVTGTTNAAYSTSPAYSNQQQPMAVYQPNPAYPQQTTAYPQPTAAYSQPTTAYTSGPAYIPPSNYSESPGQAHPPPIPYQEPSAPAYSPTHTGMAAPPPSYDDVTKSSMS